MTMQKPDTDPKACVIGNPVKHSRSPLIHNYWLSELGIKGSYGRESIEPLEAESFLKSLREHGYNGANVTLPYKELAMTCAQKLTKRASVIKAVNTLYYEGETLVGDNTDAAGFAQNIIEHDTTCFERTKTAVILGAGGAARAILYALIENNVPNIILLNRTDDKAISMAQEFHPFAQSSQMMAAPWADRETILSKADLLINTTSAGMQGQPPLNMTLGSLKQGCVVTDIVYVPLITPLLMEASERGHPIIDGLGMLLHQAVGGFEKWFGQKPQVTKALRELVLNDMGQTS
jgi:shikimate dehydrogenase